VAVADKLRAWFDQHGWKLEPAGLRAALEERGADVELIVELLDEGADRRRAQPAPEPARNGSAPAPAPVASEANVLPQNLEAEEAVLGAMMMSAGAVAAVSEILQADGSEFYRDSHATIYRAALHLYGKGEPVDRITLEDILQEQGQLEKVGGSVRVHELAAIVPASANAAHYARIVADTAILRGLIRGGGEIARLGWERPGETEQLVDQAQAITFGLTANTSQTGSEHVSAAVKQTFSRMTDLFESGSEIIGTPSGFRDIDRLTAGFEPGNLIVLAARPSMGKSGLALAFAANIAIRQQLPVGVWSLEMGRQEIAQRLLSREAHVNSMKVRTARLQPDEWARITHAAGALEKAPLHLSDQAGLTLMGLRSDLRRLIARVGELGLVIVDYLQLMASAGENRTQEVTRISQGLKTIARDFDVPLLALSQLNREVEKRADKRPVLSDLRESGSVEQDADLVAFLYRDGYYNEEAADPALTEFNLAKHRNGPTGKTDIAFVKAESTFTDLARLAFS
jgi:replicative DNA helicase